MLCSVKRQRTCDTDQVTETWGLAAGTPNDDKSAVTFSTLAVDEDTTRRWLSAVDSLKGLDQHTFLYVERSYAVFQRSLDLSAHQRMDTALVVEITGSVMDWLGSMRTFLAHSERRVKRTSGEPEYRHLCSDAYETYFGYRFLYRLRNYAQHLALPVHSLHLTESGWTILVSRDALIEQFDGWSAVRTELLTGPEDIALVPLLAEAMEAMQPIAAMTRRWDHPVAREALAGYEELRAHFERDHPGCFPVLFSTADEGPPIPGSRLLATPLDWPLLDQAADLLRRSRAIEQG
jgi:hypothetical protein